MPPYAFVWRSTNRLQQSKNKKSRSSYLFRIETGSIELSSYVRFHSSKIPLRALRESNVAIWSCMWVQKPGCLEEEDLLIFFNGDYYHPNFYCISKQIQTKRYNIFFCFFETQYKWTDKKNNRLNIIMEESDKNLMRKY